MFLSRTDYLIIFALIPDTEMLSENCHDQVKTGLGLFCNMISSLVSGDLAVRSVGMLLQSKSAVIDLVCAMEKHGLVPDNMLPRALNIEANIKLGNYLNNIMEWRQTELDAFTQQIQQMGKCVNFLTDLPGGCSVITISPCF